MPFRWSPREHVSLAAYVIKWVFLAVPLGLAVGSAVALFLWSLDLATHARWDHPWLLYLLPVAGMAVGVLYQRFGKSVDGGNNLIMEQIHQPGGGVPARMAPLVLIATLITHLFGGSAGREGTAVQMGGSIAGTMSRVLRLSSRDLRTLLMAGVAGGFGAVFGTPLTGAVFAIEVLAIGRLSYESLVPCLVASIVGDWACLRWNTGIGPFHLHVAHTAYNIGSFGAQLAGTHLSARLLGKVAVAGVAFGLASAFFAELTHSLGRIFRLLKWPALRPAIGGLAVIGLVWLVGADYLGLGVNADPHHPGQVSILSCFRDGGASPWSWWWKILFTAVTLGAGFKGGEVTPLFFVGAALGNTLAHLLGVPEHTDLFAGLGFVAVFAGATNTPLACTIMAIELFGGSQGGLLASGFVVYAAVACCLAYLMSGHSGVYLSQRIGTPKLTGLAPASLHAAREERRRWWGLPSLKRHE